MFVSIEPLYELPVGTTYIYSGSDEQTRNRHKNLSKTNDVRTRP